MSSEDTRAPSEAEQLRQLLERTKVAPKAGNQNPRGVIVDDQVVTTLRNPDSQTLVGAFVFGGERETLLVDGTGEPGYATFRRDFFDATDGKGPVIVIGSAVRAAQVSADEQVTTVAASDPRAVAARLAAKYPEATINVLESPSALTPDAPEAPIATTNGAEPTVETTPTPDALTADDGPSADEEVEEPTLVTGDERYRELARLAEPMRQRTMPIEAIAAGLYKANEMRCDPPLPKEDVERIAQEAGVTLADFYAYMPENRFIFVPTRDLWPAASVDARLPRVRVGTDTLKASKWLAQERPIEQMTWFPGAPMLIEDRLVSEGGWIDRMGVTSFNLYRPPTIKPGDATAAGLYLDHARKVFGDQADHILRFLAHRVQRPHEKINHALLLIGPQGTGKDTIITGAVPALGPWNVKEVSPEQLMGRFNDFIKSVVLRVSEARDLGEADRYRLYEHLKTYTAAPPDVLRCDEKNVREYAVPNVTGVVITSNHVDGVYLPADDRRHYVASTELTKDDFGPDYFERIYRWYAEDGYGHVAAYLHSVDLSSFRPKAPPPKTAAFWQVVDAGRPPEDAELADVLERLQEPEAVTIGELASAADVSFQNWLEDRRNRRNLSHRLSSAGYAPVRNDAAKDGLWRVKKRRQVIYARRDLPIRDRIAAAHRLMEAG